MQTFEWTDSYVTHLSAVDAQHQHLVDLINQLGRSLGASDLNRTLEDRVAQRTEALKKANQELKALSLTDALTGLPNRRHARLLLETLWQQSKENGQPVTALRIDADNFKEVNDTHGYGAGDMVLIEHE